MTHPTNVSSTAKQSASPEALVDRLFQKFALMYGRGWLDMWAGMPMDAVKADWAGALHGFEPETIRLAIEHLKTEGKPFPPAQPEFISLCRQFVRRGSHRLSLAAPRYQPPENIFAKLKRDLKA
jgi:hypothetical protein